MVLTKLNTGHKASFMAIYNIFDYCDQRKTALTSNSSAQPKYYQEELPFPEITPTEKGQFFSSLAARFFFFLLLIADVAWVIYSLGALLVKLFLCIISVFMFKPLVESISETWLSFKRSLVCLIALFVAIFSPALGIMFSCMYFLMYDKDGVEEVVPASLRDHFKEFIPE